MKSLSLMFIFACTSMVFGVEASNPREKMLGVESQSSGPISGGYRLQRVKPSVSSPEGVTFGQKFWRAFKPVEEQPKREPYLLSDYPREWARSAQEIAQPRAQRFNERVEPTASKFATSVRERVTPWAQRANARLSRWLGPREETAPLYTRAPRFSAADEEALTRAYENYVPPVNPPVHYFGPTTQQEFNRLPFDAERQALLQQPGVSKFEWLKGYLGVGSPVEAFRAWWNNRTPEQQYKKFKAEDLAAYEAAHKLAEQREIAALQRQFEQLPFEKQLDLKRKDYEQLPWWKKAVTESPDAWVARQLRERSKSMPWPTPEERKTRSEEFRKKARLTPEGYSETEWWKIPQER